MRSKLSIGILAIGTFVVVYPIMFLIVGSFMSESEIADDLTAIAEPAANGFATWSLLPNEPSLHSYVAVMFDTPQFFVCFWNSVKGVCGVIAGQIIFGVPAAWCFARYNFKYKRVLFFIYVVLMMLPFQVLMLSEYLVVRKLMVLDTLWAVILPGAFSTFPVFVIYNFFRGIPEEIIDAARVDGASEFALFRHIGLPLGKSGIIAAMILQLLEYWNVVEQPMTFLDTKHNWPLTLYLPYIDIASAGQAFAASVIALIPTLLLFLIFRDDLEKGIVASAVKE